MTARKLWLNYLREADFASIVDAYNDAVARLRKCAPPMKGHGPMLTYLAARMMCDDLRFEYERRLDADPAQHK